MMSTVGRLDSSKSHQMKIFWVRQLIVFSVLPSHRATFHSHTISSLDELSIVGAEIKNRLIAQQGQN